MRVNWHLGWMAVFAILFSDCNNDQLISQYKALHAQDSMIILQTRQDDSAIKGYVTSFNKIQENLEQIKSREKIITLNGENKTSYDPVVDIKAIDNLIIKNHLELNKLQDRLKNSNQTGTGFEILVKSLKHELKEQDAEINTLQKKLVKVNAAYQEIAQQFNDSIAIIEEQDKTITSLTKNMNTVFYAVGTMKELKEKNIITLHGGFAGIGRNIQIKPGMNKTAFSKTDLTSLNMVPLGAKFFKLISIHPPASYRIAGNENGDTLFIVNRTSFWSEGKYLVVMVK